MVRKKRNMNRFLINVTCKQFIYLTFHQIMITFTAKSILNSRGFIFEKCSKDDLNNLVLVQVQYSGDSSEN